MKAKITYISALLAGKRHRVPYYMVCFKLEDGRNSSTHIVPQYQNYGQWESYLKVGALLDGLSLLGDGTVDADSRPFSTSSFNPPPPKRKTPKPAQMQMDLFNQPQLWPD
jgi:hypothetical protein